MTVMTTVVLVQEEVVVKVMMRVLRKMRLEVIAVLKQNKKAVVVTCVCGCGGEDCECCDCGDGEMVVVVKVKFGVVHYYHFFSLLSLLLSLLSFSFFALAPHSTGRLHEGP